MKLSNIAKKLLTESEFNHKFSNKRSIINALYKLLKSEKVEGRYTDEHWKGITKLTDVFKEHNIEYDLIKAKYEHDKDIPRTTLPNRKVYVFDITVQDKNGKEIVLPLSVNCAFVGKTGTSEDDTYELTYYFMA